MAIAGYQKVQGPQVNVAPGGKAASTVSCPTGKRVLCGGFVVANDRLQPIESFPQTETTWLVTMRNPSQTADSFRIELICADA